MFTADCAEYGHFVSGDRAQGMAFSVQTFTAKITTAVASAVGMFILAAVGFVEGEGAAQTAQTIDWLWKMNALIPNISATVALVLLIIFYRLRTKDAALMLKANIGEITREEAEAQFTRKY
jgi:Na+/melibiose symporter-like transporter